MIFRKDDMMQRSKLVKSVEINSMLMTKVINIDLQAAETFGLLKNWQNIQNPLLLNPT